MKTEIIYPSEKYFRGFYDALSIVAEEQIYIEMIEAPEFEKVAAFQSKLVGNNQAVYYAVYDGRVVGWCDVSSSSNPRKSHRGGMGMGPCA